MDINQQSAKPISDDQELAKVLAGVNQQPDEPLQFDTTPALAPAAPITDQPAVSAVDDSVTVPVSVLPTPTVTPPIGYNPPEPANAPADLGEIKKEALNDLRPLVGKLDIVPEEKFDTYLLLIRSSDDQSLIAQDYAAAQAITDEARKAQALLDVIKEIDYRSNPPA